MGDVDAPLSVEASIQQGRPMKQLLPLLAFGLLVPSTALAQVDAEVATVQRRQGFLWLRQVLHHSGPAFR